MVYFVKVKTCLFLILLFIFTLSCQTGYEAHILNLDSTGRNLSVLITTPNKLMITHEDTFFIQGQAFDQVGIKKVEIRVNKNEYFTVNKDQGWNYWSKTVILETGKNIVCARVTNTNSQQKDHCVQINKSFEILTNLEILGGINQGKLGRCLSKGQDIVCMGGEWGAGQFGVFNHNYMYNTIEKKWIKNKDLNSYISSFCSSIIDDVIYYFAGVAASDDSVYQENFYQKKSFYLNTDNNWVEFDSVLTHRHRAQSIVVDKKIFLMGGINKDFNGNNFLKSVEIYDTLEPEKGWIYGPELNHVRVAFLAVYHDKKIYILGGYDENFSIVHTMEVLDTENMHLGWQIISNVPNPSFFMYGGLIKNRYIYVISGMDGMGYYSNLVRYYDILEKRWKFVGEIPEQFIKYQSSYTVHNDEIYVLGGQNDKGEMSFEFFKYKPVLD